MGPIPQFSFSCVVLGFGMCGVSGVSSAYSIQCLCSAPYDHNILLHKVDSVI